MMQNAWVSVPVINRHSDSVQGSRKTSSSVGGDYRAETMEGIWARLAIPTC